jgi:glucan phosphoethanolaminetransferase (alkaline phosphatase superfamily)
MTLGSRAWPTKILRVLCVGYTVLFHSWLALSLAAGSWESFHSRYRLPQIAAGFKFALLAATFAALAFGVAFGKRWARWVSIALGVLGLCFSAFLFWDGHLRIKSTYTGEESSEVFGAIVFSFTSLCVLCAMSLSAGRSYFDRRPRAERVRPVDEDGS